MSEKMFIADASHEKEIIKCIGSMWMYYMIKTSPLIKETLGLSDLEGRKNFFALCAFVYSPIIEMENVD